MQEDDELDLQYFVICFLDDFADIVGFFSHHWHVNWVTNKPIDQQRQKEKGQDS